jgi:geranylgeranyl reductase family protein
MSINQIPHYDVAIVGAGPAGALAAYEVAKAGLQCVILEKECLPRYKVCGGGLIYKARKALDIDIGAAIERELTVTEIALFGSTKIYHTPPQEKPMVTMVMRDQFDQILIKAACEKGAELLEAFALKALKVNGDDVHLTDASGRKVSAKMVIGADGANSAVGRLGGWGHFEAVAPALECELTVSDVDMARFSGAARFDLDIPKDGYGWIFPKGQHLSIGVGRFFNKERINLHQTLDAYLAHLGLQAYADKTVHGFVIPLHPRKEGAILGRLFLVGDAAGFADPVLGEGLSSAILSGIAVGKAIAASDMDLARAKVDYQRYIDEKVLGDLATARKLASFCYLSPTMRNWLLAKSPERLITAMTKIIMGESQYMDYQMRFMNKLKFWGSVKSGLIID